MSTFSLVHRAACDEFPGLLRGKRIVECSIERDVSGNSRATVELVLDDGVKCHLVIGPLQQCLVDADIALPQFVGAGDTPPPNLNQFQLRAV